MNDNIKLSFDSEYKIRSYDEVKFNRANNLSNESKAFIDKIQLFYDKIHSLVHTLEQHAQRIDNMKLKVCYYLYYYLYYFMIIHIQAIGLRLAVETETEQRHKQQRQLQTIINEKRTELDK